LFQMLTKYDPSVAPFKFPPMQSLNPAIPKELEDIVNRAIHLKPLQRYISVSEFKEKLEKHAEVYGKKKSFYSDYSSPSSYQSHPVPPAYQSQPPSVVSPGVSQKSIKGPLNPVAPSPASQAKTMPHITVSKPSSKAGNSIYILGVLILISALMGIGFFFGTREKPREPVPPVLPDMVFIDGGVYIRGSNTLGRKVWEQPEHEVTVSDFTIGKYEVTNKEYCAFLNSIGNRNEGGVPYMLIVDTPYCGITADKKQYYFQVKEGCEDLPVVYVSWYGAVAYCNWLSGCEGLTPCYGYGNTLDISNSGYRLPTEGEWEYACRGGTETRYYWGKEMNGDYCWYNENSGCMLHKVGEKIPNPYGLYDMSGNVWEWCTDWSWYYPDTPQINPVGNPNGPGRIVRGSSFKEGGICSSIYRNLASPEIETEEIGFRLVRRP